MAQATSSLKLRSITRVRITRFGAALVDAAAFAAAKSCSLIFHFIDNQRNDSIPCALDCRCSVAGVIRDKLCIRWSAARSAAGAFALAVIPQLAKCADSQHSADSSFLQRLSEPVHAHLPASVICPKLKPAPLSLFRIALSKDCLPGQCRSCSRMMSWDFGKLLASDATPLIPCQSVAFRWPKLPLVPNSKFQDTCAIPIFSVAATRINFPPALMNRP